MEGLLVIAWDQQRSRNLKMRDKKGGALSAAEDTITKGGVLKGIEPEHEMEKKPRNYTSLKPVQVNHL